MCSRGQGVLNTFKRAPPPFFLSPHPRLQKMCRKKTEDSCFRSHQGEAGNSRQELRGAGQELPWVGRLAQPLYPGHRRTFGRGVLLERVSVESSLKFLGYGRVTNGMRCNLSY